MGRTIGGVINVCNILFDEKFRAFIQTMRNKFIDVLESSNNCPY